MKVLRVIRTKENLKDKFSDSYLKAIQKRASAEGVEVRVITQFTGDFTQKRLELYLDLFPDTLVLEPCEFTFNRELTLDKYLTAKAIKETVNEYGRHLNVVVMNRSQLIGIPLAKMLLDDNHTVSICHSKTFNKDLYRMCYHADIVVTATGKIQKFLRDCPAKVIDISNDTRLSSEFLLAGQGEIGKLTLDLLFEELVND